MSTKSVQHHYDVAVSLPLRECGLKVHYPKQDGEITAVTPLAGVWIESLICLKDPRASTVTPLAGVWIERLRSRSRAAYCTVTPLAGVWIESLYGGWTRINTKSLPLRECGLKGLIHRKARKRRRVTPLAGVWIESYLFLPFAQEGLCHSPCGSVD